jgi:hypothetical protein
MDLELMLPLPLGPVLLLMLLVPLLLLLLLLPMARRKLRRLGEAERWTVYR